jgi:transcriptional regulator with XRE-family HTH domain
MPALERTFDRSGRRSASIVLDLSAEIRRARLQHGLSQAEVARAAHTSRPQLSRLERGKMPRVSILVVCHVLAVLGLELSARAYPAGQPIRDAAHRALLDRLRARVGPRLTWRYERPVGGEGDLRAWDAAISGPRIHIGVEAETRVGDVQALQRRIGLKLRDDAETDCALLLLSNTRDNRAIVRENLTALQSDFPVDGRWALEAIKAGESPGGNSVVLL